MIDEKTMVAIIAKSTQDECRQMGALFMSFAEVPRDVNWESQMRHAMMMYPEPPKSGIAEWLESSRAKYTASNDEMWRAGWHPVQMRKKLEELGYTGEAESTAWQDPADVDFHRHPAAVEGEFEAI
jgi:hypothetical protein